jgi:hypothetical protein
MITIMDFKLTLLQLPAITVATVSVATATALLQHSLRPR